MPDAVWVDSNINSDGVVETPEKAKRALAESGLRHAESLTSTPRDGVPVHSRRFLAKRILIAPHTHCDVQTLEKQKMKEEEQRVSTGSVINSTDSREACGPPAG
ncbi:hypothetical protein RRG08_060646 [Elysia crispata]|uniref:Uncharacterized protein n=1 Tax=Elysia crispata TaxID=231223 RepID=A0AAE1ATB9_9GAST|nr:hypothetical protein RRG08_060646 [Elysia crispata]